jgi:hypothetical protein
MVFQTHALKEKLQPLAAEIGCTHHLIILDRCKDDLQREFYIRMTHKFGWSKFCRVGGAQRNPPALRNSFSLIEAKEPSMCHYLEKPIGVGEYRVVSRLSKELMGQLPTPEQIEAF